MKIFCLKNGTLLYYSSGESLVNRNGIQGNNEISEIIFVGIIRSHETINS